MKIAVFPGSFDPVTIGHQDIIARASKLFDRVYVSIVPNGTKTHPMFTDEQKLALMRASVEEFPNVEAELGGGLLTDYALRKNAQGFSCAVCATAWILTPSSSFRSSIAMCRTARSKRCCWSRNRSISTSAPRWCAR